MPGSREFDFQKKEKLACMDIMYYSSSVMAQRIVKSISVPPDLAAAMDRFPDENWSAIACEGFRERIERNRMTAIIDNKDRAVERLKQSKKKLINQRFQDGFDAGKKYVIDDAEFSELETLKKALDGHRGDYSAVIGNDDEGGMWNVLQVMTNDDEDGSVNDTMDRLRDRHGNEVETNDWAEGFIKGAMDQFSDLESEL